MSEQQESGNKQPQKITLPLEWMDADDLPVFYANQIAVNFIDDQFFVLLGRVAPPPLIPQMPLPKKIIIHPLFKVATSPDAMFAITNVMIDVVNQFCRANNLDPRKVLQFPDETKDE